MKIITVLCLLSLFVPSVRAEVAEMSVILNLDGSDFVFGERIRGVVDIANPSPNKVSVGYDNSEDLFFIEVYRASDMTQLTRISKHPFVARFSLESGEGQKLEVFLGDHYAFRETNRYLAKPVLVHRGARYEGALRAFDIVEGVKVASATQLFANRKGLQREFQLVYWSRQHKEHLFLRARDAGVSDRIWETRDLGAILRHEKPSISIQPNGEVVVLHRINQDNFVRSEFWSLSNELVFRIREAVRDPVTAATSRVRDLYKDGGIKPKENPWWKFW